MPKGCFPKLKDSICNVTIHANEITDILPQVLTVMVLRLLNQKEN